MLHAKAKHDTLPRVIALLCVSALALPRPVSAADLQPATIAAFDRYTHLTEAQFDDHNSPPAPFLWIDTLPQSQRDAAYTQLRAGQVVIAPLATLDSGAPIPVPNGLIHHWIGTVFIPGATLARTLAFEEDYDHQAQNFQPNVIASKTLRRSGPDFTILLRFHQKKIVTVVLDTEHEVHYDIIDATRATSRSRSTRIQQVDHLGEANEKLEPVGHDDGFLWRMNTYWRFEQKDGGTYVESQSVSLTRDIPTGLGWLIGPYVTTVPRESLTFTLTTTRSALSRQ